MRIQHFILNTFWVYNNLAICFHDIYETVDARRKEENKKLKENNQSMFLERTLTLTTKEREGCDFFIWWQSRASLINIFSSY